MASITIRNLDQVLKARLRVRAAQHGRSMEEEVRQILRVALGSGDEQPRVRLATAIHALFKPLGGVDLPEIEREPMGEPPKFE